jgi:hypothetical protein
MNDVLNCWEFMKCGREVGGAKVTEHGPCPVSTCVRANGIHYGKNGGRVCWAVPGAMCKTKTEITYDGKITGCVSCAFYRLVQQEESMSFLENREIQLIIT